jgi:hypothetical protein
MDRQAVPKLRYLTTKQHTITPQERENFFYAAAEALTDSLSPGRLYRKSK